MFCKLKSLFFFLLFFHYSFCTRNLMCKLPSSVELEILMKVKCPSHSLEKFNGLLFHMNKGLHLLTWITVVPLKENSTGSLPWVRNLDPALSSHLVKDHIPSTSPCSVSLHKISHTIAPMLWTDWYLVQIHYPGKEPVEHLKT
jgi:hypothetical protein